MLRQCVGWVLTLLLLLVPCQSRSLIVGYSWPPQITAPSNVVVEAGSYIDVLDFSGWITGFGHFEKSTALTGYEGDGYLTFDSLRWQVPPDGAGLEYDLYFATPGTYYIWFRLNSSGDAGDSYFFGLDGEYVSRLYAMLYDTWAWTNDSGSYSDSITVTSAGAHTLNIWGREPTTAIDGVVLSASSGAVTPNDTSQIPSGITQIYPHTTDYVASYLYPAEVSGSDVVLTWQLPETEAGAPVGGYDTIVDGLDNNEHIASSTKTITGLAQDIQHSFQVESRWVQADPDQLLMSNVVYATIPGSGGTDLFSLEGDPNFNIDNLSSTIRTWYDRLWYAINNEDKYPDVDTRTSKGCNYEVGRYTNEYVTGLLHVFRVVGDYDLLDEIDRVMELARAELQDWSRLSHYDPPDDYQADGYLNWTWQHDPDNADYYGTDDHPMDEMMAHSLVASAMYAFYVNKDVPGISSERATRYTERFNFWFDYLENHFEAKWRDRNGVETGFPFLEKALTHPVIQFIRYHHYMYKVTGDTGYQGEVQRLVNLIDSYWYTTSTDAGLAWQWDHCTTEASSFPCHLQSTSYGRYTVEAATDLRVADVEYFDDLFMQKLANTCGQLVMDEQVPTAVAYYVDGTGTATDDVFAITLWTSLGFWDPTKDTTDRVLDVGEQIMDSVETNIDQPRRIYIPAGIVFSLYRQ